MKPTRSLLSFLFGSVFLTAQMTKAATYNWDGDTSSSWSDPLNWDTLPTNNLTSDIANFNLATYGGNPVFAPNAGTTSINGLTIGALNGAMTLTTTNLSIGNSGISIANGAGAFTISGALTLGAAQSWTNNDDSLFTVSGAVTNSTNLLTIGGAGNTTINGVIGNGAGGLTKNDAGILTLGAANTYTGLTTVNGGELRWGIVNALSSGNLTVNNGGTVNMQTFADTVGTVTLAQGGTITGSTGVLTTGASGLVINDGGAISGFSGAGGFTLGGNLSYNDVGTSTTATINRLYMGGAVSRTFTIADGDDASGVDLDITSYLGNTATNSFTLIKAGAGVMQLSGGATANTNWGTGSQILINEGTLLLNKNSGVDALTSTSNAADVIIGDGTGAAGSAILRLNNSNQIFQVSIEIKSDGLFDLNGFNETLESASTSTLTHSAGGSLTTGAGTLTLASATNTISGASTVTGNLTFSGTAATNLTIGGTANINGTTTFSSTGGITATGTPTIQGTLALGSGATHAVAVTNLADNLNISAQITGDTGITTKSGAGTLTLSGTSANTYSGTIAVSAGELQLGKTGVNAIGGNLTVSGGVVKLTGTGGDQIANSRNVVVSSGTFDLNGLNETVNGVQLTGGTITGGVGVLTGTTAFDMQAGTVSAILGGSIGLNKTTTGTVTLSGANTYTGNTTVSAGLLSTTNAAALSGFNSAGKVIFNGGTLGVQVGGAGWTTGEVDTLLTNATKNSGSLGLDTTNGGFTQWTAFTTANLGLTLGLTKFGTGTLVLDQSNTYRGATSITAGTLSLTGSLTSLSISTSGTGIFTQSGTGVITGETSFTQGSSGTSILSLTNTYTGNTTIAAGTLNANSSSALGSAFNNLVFNGGTLQAAGTITSLATRVVTMTGAGTIDTNNNAVSIAGIISGTGALTKSGLGTLTLSAANTFSGNTTISAGVLELTNDRALQNSVMDTTGLGTITLSSVTTPTFGGLSGGSGDLASVISSGYATITNLTLNLSGSATYGGAIANNTAGMDLTKTGAGTQTLQGVNSYAGDTFLNAGTLTLSGTGSILSSAITFNGGELNLINTAAETGSGRVSNSAAITSNGGTLTYTNTSGANVYAETIGSVALTSGQWNVNLATNQASTGSQTLILSGLTQSGTGSVTFSAGTTAPNATKNRIQVSGASATAAGQIIGSWATTGTAANNQNDYAVYDASGYIVSANITASAETTWTTAANAYTLSTPAKSATALTATRNIVALKASSTATATTSNTVSGSPTFTISTGHSFAVGDPVALSSFGGDLNNFNVGRVYYVAAITGTTFTLAATPGGTAINAGAATSVQFTGGIKLDNGINLGTTGILNSGNAPLAVGRTATGGYVTLPTAGAGNLYVTTGLSPVTAANSGLNGRISIDAPIVDNGGALTLVKNGAGVLHLQGTNTYTGGTVINAGTVIFTDGTSGANFGTAGITFNGSGALSFGPNSSWGFASGGTVTLSRPVTLNNGSIAGFYYNSPNTTMNISGAITGNGGIISGKDPVVTYNGGDGTIGINFTSTGNNFTGPLTINNVAAIFNSLGDGSSPMILNAGFTYGSGAIANLLIPNRLVDVRATTTITNSAGSTRTVTFGDVTTTTTGAKTLTLSNTSSNGAGFITGNITNGAGSLSVNKSGSGNWTISGSNTYTGVTSSDGGLLIINGKNALPTNSVISFDPNQGSAGNGTTIRFLMDDTGTVNLGNQINVRSAQTAAQGQWGVFVGNTSSANGGIGGGTNIGSTIALGKLNFSANIDNRSGGQLNVTGANGYRLELGDVDLGLNISFSYTLNPTTAPLTVAGTVKQINGKTGAHSYRADHLVLGGTSGGNLVSGVITDAADYTDSSNANARPLGVTKSSTSIWSLSGTNTYSGTTRIAGGTLIVNNLANGGVNSSIGKSSSAAVNLVLGAGTLRYAPISAVGGNGATIDRNFMITGSGIIEASGTGALVFGQTGVISQDVTGLTGSWAASGSAVVSGLSSTANLAVGMRVSGTGITAGTTIASIDSASQVTLSANTTVLGSAAAINFGYTARALTLAGTNTGANTIAGILQDSSAAGAQALSVTKADLGTWVLSGANTYTGTTTVNAGTLVLDMTGSGALASTSPLTLGGGNFRVKGGATSAQTLGALTLSASTNSTITLDPNNGTSTTLTLGNAWTRNAGSSLLIDYSSSNTGTRQVVTAGATTGYTLSNGIYGAILVKDSAGVTGFATRAAGATQAITRYDDTSGTTLVDNSNAAGTNFTTLNTVYTSGTLNWNNGVTTRLVNSLTFDTTNNGGTINMGASGNILTLTSLGILFKGANNGILTGGQVGAAASEVVVHQTGTGSLTINSLISSGAGSLTKNGSGTLILGATNSYTGQTTVSAGALTFAGSSSGTLGSVQVGGAGTATLNIEAGNYTQGAGGFYVGANGGTGTVNQSGGTVTWNNTGLQLLVGNGGFAGTYNLSGGSLTTLTGTNTRGVMLGVNNGSSATFNLSGTGNLTVAGTSRLMIGRSDAAVTGTTNLFSQTGGTATISDLTIGGPSGGASGANSTLIVTAGTFTAAAFSLLSDGVNDVSTINIGGTAIVTLPNLPTSRGAGATATLHFDGGTLRNSGTGTFITGLTNAFIQDGGAQFDTTLNSTTISQNLLTHSTSLGGGLTKIGINTLTLSGINTYTGATTVSAGTLNIASGGSTAAGSAVTVSNSGSALVVNGAVNGTLVMNASTTLSGAGTINGAATISGIHAPGNSPGIQTFSNGLNYGSTATLNAEFVGDSLGLRGTDYDGVNVTGGNLSIDLLASLSIYASGIDYSAAVWDATRDFTIIDYTGGGTSNGVFALVTTNAGSFASEGSWSIANTSNDVVLSWTPIPEPGAVFLGSMGLLLILRRRR